MIYLVGGARPNFIKIAAISRAFETYKIAYEIIHTGQHYDYNMDKVFFDDLCLKKPYAHLNVGSGTHSEQTAKIMYRFEKLCILKRPDMVFTVGDVNSTMAAALVAAKLRIPLSHQEAGMRSGDMDMPEEVNRIVTDHISDYLFPISIQDKNNLSAEGISKNVFLVGDVMIDSLLHYMKFINKIKQKYILVEIHRPANVDDRQNLKQIIMAIARLAKMHQIIFSVHPRTKKMISQFKFWPLLSEVRCVNPMGYFKFLKYMSNAFTVITDSDGIQQETSVLDIPCVSVRNTTNIQYTVKYGTNTLVEPNADQIYMAVLYARKRSDFPEELKKLNDGNASKRIADIIKCQIM